MHEAVGTEDAEALPEQSPTQALALLGGEFANGQNQPPATIPVRGLCGVNMPRCLFKAPTPRVGQHIVGAPAHGFGAQPGLLAKSKHRGTNQAPVEFERFEQTDQTAQPDPAATRQNGIAKDRNNERTGLDASLLPKFVEAGLDGLDHGSGGSGKRGMLSTPPSPEQRRAGGGKRRG